MAQKYFYFVRTQTGTLGPRKCDGWPPVGGETNDVAWKIAITDDEFRRRLSALDLKYRKQVKTDLTQE